MMVAFLTPHNIPCTLLSLLPKPIKPRFTDEESEAQEIEWLDKDQALGANNLIHFEASKSFVTKFPQMGVDSLVLKNTFSFPSL